MKKTKNDNLHQPATKGDVKKLELATKKDLKDLEQRLGGRTDGLKDYMDHAFGELREEMYTKADHSKFMILIDETITELRDAREGRVLSEAQIMRLDDHVMNHEKRLVVLEHK